MKRLFSLCVLLMLCAISLFAQKVSVKGTVSDDNGNPLAGVNVVPQGSKTGTQTNDQGAFTISVSKVPIGLVFSYVGFGTKMVVADGKADLKVSLLPEAKESGDDVVVIGYQTVKRRDLTSSVSSINAKDIKDIPVNSTAEALTGRLAGVQITTSEGSPDATATIKVRGGGSITQDNSPLYIVDGMQVENALSVLAPQDIESIDVLKDAAATAIYGARGANGVVIITTKGGKGNKTTVNYNGLVGIRQLANRLTVMNPYEFVLYQYERTRGSQSERTTFQNTYGRWEDLELYKTAPLADWQDEMFGRNALMQTHNVSVMGGSESTKFNLSLTSNTEEGVMLGSDFDRKLMNFKLDHTVNKKLKVGMTTRFNHTVVNGAGTANAGSSGTNRLRHAIKYRPILMGGQDLLDYDPDYALETNANGLSLVNPILLNQAEYRRNTSNTLNLSAYFNLQLTKFLSFRSTLGIDYGTRRDDAFNDTITSTARQNANQPTASINNRNTYTLNNSNVFTFNFNKVKGRFFEKNTLDGVLGQELYQYTLKENGVETRYFPVGINAKSALGNMGLGSAPVGSTQPPPSSNEYTERLFSFFGRVNYSYDERYLLSLTMRADGSSKFASGYKWGYFPSASAAWRISKEKWMEDLSPTVSDLKIRFTYGKAGNNRIPNFLYLSQFEANVNNSYYSINDQNVAGFISRELANAGLIWEGTTSRDLGIDLGLFNNRITLTVDGYINSTYDLLVRVPVPASSGYTSQIQNVGETSNKGIEIQLGATPIRNKHFTWNSNFNISFNKNKIENLGSGANFYLFSSGWGGSNQPSDYIVKVGMPVGTIWGLKTAGMYGIDDFDYNSTNGTYTLKSGVPSNQSITATVPQPGTLKFVDNNNDGVINDLDRTVIGNTQPKFFGGWNNQFAYKNFDLSVFMNFQYGNDVYNANKLEFTSGYTINSNMISIMNDRWRTVNNEGNVVTDPTALAKLNEGVSLWQPLRSASSFYVHSWAIEDGSFLRINNVTLGYTLPNKILQRVKIKSLRIYATANNLAIFTNYSGYDPEVNTRRGTPLTPGVDYSAYPRSRAYICGLNLSF